MLGRGSKASCLPTEAVGAAQRGAVLSEAMLSPARRAHLVLPALLTVPPATVPALDWLLLGEKILWATPRTDIALPPALSPASGSQHRGALWPLLGTPSTPVCCFQQQSCRNCITIKMQLALPGKCEAASVPTDSFTCLEVESVQYLAGSAELINLFNNDA